MESPKHINTLIDPDNSKPLYTLRIASQLADVPAHSIRQYIDIGLLIPYKLESKHHLFSRSDISRLKLIQGLIRDKGLNFAGVRALMGVLPCWAIRECADSDRNSCGAYSENLQPCWEASEKGRLCRNENCRECVVYRSLELDSGVKSVLRGLL